MWILFRLLGVVSMVRSKIIKEILNGEISLSLSLKRLKVLLYELNNKEILKWIDCELSGYENKDKIPEYRCFAGQVFISFRLGNKTYKDIQVSMKNIPNELGTSIAQKSFHEAISVIEHSSDLQKNTHLIRPEFYKFLITELNVVADQFFDAHILITSTAEKEILAKVNNKVLEILLFLEKEYGNLDEFDIDFSLKSPEEKQIVEQYIFNSVVDNSITIGNENTIKNTDISSNIGEN